MLRKIEKDINKHGYGVASWIGFDYISVGIFPIYMPKPQRSNMNDVIKTWRASVFPIDYHKGLCVDLIIDLHRKALDWVKENGPPPTIDADFWSDEILRRIKQYNEN